MTAGEIIALLGLSPLEPEGGFFRETYRSRESAPASGLPPRYGGDRAFSTAIYYLLTPETSSALHRLPSDEIFHFYLGDPVEMLLLGPEGSGEIFLLGNDLAAGMRPQAVVPAGTWQGARLGAGGRFALTGTTVAPGFDYADFELGERSRLAAAYPAFGEMIAAMTRPTP